MSNHGSLREAGILESRVPRYTSYPPANHFNLQIGPQQMEAWIEALPQGARVSLYLHLPFCRRLCNFCACRTQGTLTDRPLFPYVDTLLQEIALLKARLPQNVTISRVHLGGGTPTILPPELLRQIGEAVRDIRPFSDDFEMSIEIDPTEFSAPIADALLELGMGRASIGVQDFDPRVQEAIGRVQSYDITREAVILLRRRGIESINMDLLYGLPHQTPTRFVATLEKVIDLAPDRIALYGYAHVPWVAKRQQLINEADLPTAQERVALFEMARQMLLSAGYLPIGIDHFALPRDSLTLAAVTGKLRRNFQGYSDEDCDALIGLGASSISRFPQGFAQNAPITAQYVEAIEAGRFATKRGHAFSRDDLLRGAMIQELMCHFSIDLARHAAEHGVSYEEITEILVPMIAYYGEYFVKDGDRLELVGPAAYVARLVAHQIDAYVAEVGHHALAV